MARLRSSSSPVCYLERKPRRMAGEAVVRIKRVYEAPARGDGFRVLVDRLWPRGLRKDLARVDLWAREVAPSTELRKWFGHDPERWSEFRRRYLLELQDHAADLSALKLRAVKRPLTLLYASREQKVNHAIVLEEAIRNARLPAG